MTFVALSTIGRALRNPWALQTLVRRSPGAEAWTAIYVRSPQPAQARGIR